MKSKIKYLVIVGTIFCTTLESTLTVQATFTNGVPLITQIQAPDPGLPGGVTYPKGLFGSLVSELFDSSGRMYSGFLTNLLSGVSNNVLPKWNGSNLVGSSISDNGSITSIGQSTSIVQSSWPALDVTGGVRINGGNWLYLQNNRLYGDNATALYYDSNDSNTTQFILRDNEATPYGTIHGSGNGANFGLLDGDSQWSYMAVKDSNTDLRINNVSVVHLLANGNVGIGTLGPAQKLDVSGAIAMLGKTVISGNANDVYTESRVIRNTSSTLTDGMYVNYGSTDSANNSIRFYGAGNAEMARIHNNGNVSIGNVISGQKLDVTGNIKASGDVMGNRICDTTGGTCTNLPLVTTNYWIASGSNISNSNSGYVGINTNAPSERLHVVGNAKISGVVKATSYCDINGNNCLTGTGGSGGNSKTVLSMTYGAGASHWCAIMNTSEKELYCWGRSDNGQAGNGTNFGNQYVAARVPIVKDMVQLVYPYVSTCGLKSDGTVWCWGYNGYGQLGDGTTTQTSFPHQVGITGVAQLSATYGTVCARKTDGTVWCWGYDGYGQLGNDATLVSQYTPVQVSGLTGITDIKGNYDDSYPADFFCALKNDGTVWCWGYNGYGQLGNNTTTSSGVPVRFGSSLTGVTKIAVGGAYAGFACALKSDGTIWCSGYNGYGQLGNNSTTSSSIPVQAGNRTDYTNVYLPKSSNYGMACSITTGGTVYCWGYNGYGQLGDGTAVSKSVPTAVIGLGGIVITKLDIQGYTTSDNGEYVCAVSDTNNLYCWGYNGQYNLGIGNATTSISTPTKIVGLDNIVSDVYLSGGAGYRVGFAKTLLGDLYTWGDNYGFCTVGNGCNGASRYQTIPTKISFGN